MSRARQKNETPGDTHGKRSSEQQRHAIEHTLHVRRTVVQNNIARIHTALLLAVNNTYHDGLLTISFL